MRIGGARQFGPDLAHGRDDNVDELRRAGDGRHVVNGDRVPPAEGEPAAWAHVHGLEIGRPLTAAQNETHRARLKAMGT